MEYFELMLYKNPSGVFYPCQTVSGRAIFKSSKKERTTGIVLKLEGKASVHWTEKNICRPEQRRPTDSFDSSELFYKSGNMLIFGDGKTERIIPPGEVSYPFYIQLPKSQLYTSFTGEFGKVVYTLHAVIKQSGWKDDNETKLKITVNAIVDLNLIPMAAVPGNWHNSKSFCCFCCTSGPLSLNVSLPRKGYCPGEIIVVEMEINNASNKLINDLSLEMWQKITYFAAGNSKSRSKAIASVKRGQSVPPLVDSDCWRVEVKVPDVPSTNLGGCRIISLEYSLKVKAKVSGVSLNLVQWCPIVIGTVPLRSMGYDGNSNAIFPSSAQLQAIFGA